MSAPALIVAHPGHELMVFGWMEDVRPRLSVLTDGSGRSGVSRVGSSERLVHAAGAEAGSVWGAVSDRAFYSAVLEGNIEVFTGLAGRLYDDLIRQRPPYVAGDAREGFNPIHDICRSTIDAVVARVRRGGGEIANYAFSLFSPHDRCPARDQSGTIVKRLEKEQLGRKVAAAHAYPELAAETEAAFSGTSRRILAAHPELAKVVDASMGGMNVESLATECLVPVDAVAAPWDAPPFYEIYGERLVADGTYPQAIRYREHVLPIEMALGDWKNEG